MGLARSPGHPGNDAGLGPATGSYWEAAMSAQLGWHDELVVRYVHSLGRPMVWVPALMALLLMLTCPSRAVGQGWRSGPEVRPFVGAYVPTGKQRALLKQGVTLGAQAALEFGRGVHAVAAFSWVPTEQRGLGNGNRVEMAQF